MTNNNGIPFEVKKPFETVQELKNEVPSFEEFMKTYESDDNLNYDDLTFSDISDKGKGYGPCTSDYCTHSRSELQEQLKEAERELESLRSQLSRASSWNITVVQQNIIIVEQRITAILINIGRVPRLGSFYWEGYLQESTNRDLLNWTGNSNSRWQSDRRDHPNFNLGLTWDRNPNFGRNEWYTNQTFRIRSIETARKVLRWIDNGWLFLRAGFFMGADYDDVCRNNTVAVAASLRRAIERCENGEDVHVEERYTFYT